MSTSDTPLSRVETVIAAALYLMTAYQRTRCPRLAACVAAHLDCLTRHPHVDPTIRAVCAEMRADWRAAAEPAPLRDRVH